MVFIDYPRYYPIFEYENTIAKMVDSLRSIDGIVAIYQLGSVGQSGISDIDLLAVIKDSVSYASDPRETLNKKEKYFISHGLYGLSEAHVPGAKKFGFFFQPKLLWGKDLFGQYVPQLEKNELDILKIQIALEFLLKMYINTVVEQTYGIIKVRALLLQAKALLMDLDLLNIEECRLREMLKKILEWRKNWFDSPPSKKMIISWINEFQKELPFFLGELLQKHTFYLEFNNKIRMGNNIAIENYRELSFIHKGITFPWLGFLGRRYFNLLHRFNHFIIKFPYQTNEIPKIISDSQNYFSVSKKWLAEHAKHFMPLSSSFVSSIAN